MTTTKMNKFWLTGAAGIALACLMTSPDLQAQTEPVRVIVIGAHPDDCDLDAGGTAILFAKMGHKVKFLSVTNGDAGHHEMGGGMLAARRRAEALEAGRRFGVEYEVLDNHDGELMPTLEIRKEIIRRIRRWNADVVISPRPNDYHPDHRYTAMLVQDAAYMVIVPNVAPDTPPLVKNPVFLYSSDGFKKPNPFQPDIAVDISSVWDQKVYAMSAHESQFFEWLPWTSGALAEVPSKPEDRLKWLSNWRGQEINDATRAALAFWYGEEHARGVRYVETFEICEYGRQPNREEIARLFPMIRKP
jgi:LmbE family N-acetylglucosaminyl deacetylase